MKPRIREKKSTHIYIHTQKKITSSCMYFASGVPVPRFVNIPRDIGELNRFRVRRRNLRETPIYIRLESLNRALRSARFRFHGLSTRRHKAGKDTKQRVVTIGNIVTASDSHCQLSRERTNRGKRKKRKKKDNKVPMDFGNARYLLTVRRLPSTVATKMPGVFLSFLLDRSFQETLSKLASESQHRLAHFRSFRGSIGPLD